MCRQRRITFPGMLDGIQGAYRGRGSSASAVEAHEACVLVLPTRRLCSAEPCRQWGRWHSLLMPVLAIHSPLSASLPLFQRAGVL